jgi:hypothetical protein
MADPNKEVGRLLASLAKHEEFNPKTDPVIKALRARIAKGKQRREIAKKLPAPRDMTEAQRKIIVHESKSRSTEDICDTFGISTRTLQRWRAKYN